MGSLTGKRSNGDSMANYYNGTKVLVRNLSERADERDLRDFFKSCGGLNSVWVARNPPGFGFVWFDDSRVAQDAVAQFDGKELLGARVRVDLSKQNGDGKGGGRGDDLRDDRDDRGGGDRSGYRRCSPSPRRRRPSAGGAGLFASSAPSTGGAVFFASSAPSIGDADLFGTPSTKPANTVGSSSAGMPKSWLNCQLKQFNGKDWTTRKGSLVVEKASGVIRWKLVQDDGLATAIDHMNPQPGLTGRQIALSKTLVIVAADEHSREDILNECSHSTQRLHIVCVCCLQAWPPSFC